MKNFICIYLRGQLNTGTKTLSFKPLNLPLSSNLRWGKLTQDEGQGYREGAELEEGLARITDNKQYLQKIKVEGRKEEAAKEMVSKVAGKLNKPRRTGSVSLSLSLLSLSWCLGSSINKLIYNLVSVIGLPRLHEPWRLISS